ncbi:hypothetical protein NC652_012136 [Populus alba x Populus x berolinensis]|nr:hypothetical protein NC652_012136 [Populus alba x Populus x berolinensis]
MVAPPLTGLFWASTTQCNFVIWLELRLQSWTQGLCILCVLIVLFCSQLDPPDSQITTSRTLPRSC